LSNPCYRVTCVGRAAAARLRYNGIAGGTFRGAAAIPSDRPTMIVPGHALPPMHAPLVVYGVLLLLELEFPAAWVSITPKRRVVP